MVVTDSVSVISLYRQCAHRWILVQLCECVLTIKILNKIFVVARSYFSAICHSYFYFHSFDSVMSSLHLYGSFNLFFVTLFLGGWVNL